jgi:hypothetical protein
MRPGLFCLRRRPVYKRVCRFRGTSLVFIMGSYPALRRSCIDPSDAIRSLSRMACQDASAGHRGSTLALRSSPPSSHNCRNYRDIRRDTLHTLRSSSLAPRRPRGDMGALNSRSGGVVWPIPVSLLQSGGHWSKQRSLVRRTVWPRADVKRPAKEKVAPPMSAIAVAASFQLDGISYLRNKRDLGYSATIALIQIKSLCPETPPRCIKAPGRPRA